MMTQTYNRSFYESGEYKNKLKYTWNIRKTLELEAVFVYSRFIVY